MNVAYWEWRWIPISPIIATSSLSYTTPGDHRITRITANASFTAMEPGSEIILLSGLPRQTTIHKAGDLRFHPSDSESLFTTVGDDARGHISSGGVFQVQDPDFYIGKVLRISKDNGERCGHQSLLGWRPHQHSFARLGRRFPQPLPLRLSSLRTEPGCTLFLGKWQRDRSCELGSSRLQWRVEWQ